MDGKILWVGDKPRPRLAEKLRRAWGRVNLSPDLYQAEILHDDWCAIWDGGDCTCNPVISFRRIRVKEGE